MKNDNNYEHKVKMSRFPMSVYLFVFVVCMLMSGIHFGMILMFNKIQAASIIQVHAVLIYWAAAALIIVWYVRRRIKKKMEEPIYKILDATEAISKGDFSIYIEPNHTPDKRDYLDVIILNINKMVEELGSIETLKTDFVSNVSHEMKTPISVIKNAARLMKKEDLTQAKKEEYLSMIDGASTRLSGLISNILKLNKLENQTMSLNMKRYDVSRQICDSLLQFENCWEEKQIELDVDVEDHAYIFADEELMELVWNNLMSNAVKFTEKNGRISIRQWFENGSIIVSVSDTGCGMTEENRKHIFDKFYQGDTSHATEGNGLGLALVARVISLMNGNIQVESELGKGSTFTVTISECNTEEKQEA